MEINAYIKKIKNQRSKNFLKTALKKGISIEVVSENFKILKLTQKNKCQYLFDEKFFLNRKPGTLFTKNKEITKTLLRAKKISVPRGIISTNKKDALKLMKKEKISFPVVIKPLDMAKGMGVSVNVKNEKQVSLAIKKIEKLQKKAPQKYSNFFMIEEMVSGNDYRILVLNNSVVACAQRIPATITGDNRTPIIDIIKSFNAQRPPAYQIKIDNEIKYFLKKHHLALGSILKKNQQLQLRENANISSGGRAIDLTKKISPRFKKIALQAFNALGLTYAGIDIITTDITANSSSQKYWIIEINGAPDYDIHEKPLIEGPGVDITNQLVDFFMQKPQS